MNAVCQRPRRSKGALILSRMGRQSEIAQLVGCTDALVGHWMRGDRVPSPQWRGILEQLYAIPEGAWDLPIQSGLSPVPSLRQKVARALAPWPEAQTRADDILRRGGIR